MKTPTHSSSWSLLSPRWDVLGCGIVCVDDLLYVDHYPEPDTKVPVMDVAREGGGLTGTALVAAARFGSKASYGGVLGFDELSLYTIEALETEGVDVSPVIRQNGASVYHSVVVIDQQTKSRTIFYSKKGVSSRPIEQMTPELIGDCRVLLVDMFGAEAALHAAEIARDLGIPVVADIETTDEPGTMALIELVDHLILPAALASQLCDSDDPGEMIRRLYREERNCTAVTWGDRGVWYALEDGKVRHQPAFKVEPVNTNGCGDTFHGVYAACLAEGTEPQEAIVTASAAAAIKATHPGVRSGIPKRKDIEECLRENGF